MPSLEQLERRIAKLERETASDSEALQPNYLTIDPTTGLIGASFTGLINALGLILPAGTTPAGQPKNKIVWENSNGAVIADLTAYQQSGVEKFHAESFAQGPTDASDTYLEAYDDLGNLRAFLGVFQGSRGTSANVVIGTGAGSRTLIDQNGMSDLLQTGSTVLSMVTEVTCTFPGASTITNINTVSLPGATGFVFGIGTASAFNTILDTGVVDIRPVGAGKVDVRVQSRVGATPAAGTGVLVQLLLWGT